MKLTFLLESDEENRRLERSAATGDPSQLTRLANNYLRSGDRRLDKLIDALWDVNDPNAWDIIKSWAIQNQVPNADQFLTMVHQNYENVVSRVDADEDELPDEQVETLVNAMQQATESIANRAKEFHFKLIEEDESGRSGVWHSAEVYLSPAGGYFWIYMHSWGSGGSFNYGTIEEEDLTDAMSDSLVDYFAEMSW